MNMSTILIKSPTIVNENQQFIADILIKDGFIERIAPNIDANADQEINAEGLHLFPGLIDDQVHFREPGLTHKADIWHESRAAVAGGTTSFMEMPNTVPNTLTQKLLADKYALASKNSLANYSFYMGASNDNLEEVLATDARDVCGIKVFMGSSTGHMLVDDEKTLEQIFSSTPMLIATHCEDERTIRNNLARIKEKLGEDITIEQHPMIRSEEACFLSSSKAVELAKKYNSRLHVLHVSTAKEVALFDHTIPLAEKRITAEACVHHLWFTDDDYARKGNFIKWNPAVKTPKDRAGLWKGLLEGRIDVVATDHAPHTWDEKTQPYLAAPSGGPLVQHTLQALLDFYFDGKWSLEQMVQKSSHHPAICFGIEKRGFVKEGFWADLVLADLSRPETVVKENLFSKCRWSPFEGHTFKASVTHTLVSGTLVYENGQFLSDSSGKRLRFNR